LIARLSQQANHVFGIDAIFFAAEVSKCDRWLRCHAVIFAVALFLRTFYGITQFDQLQGVGGWVDAIGQYGSVKENRRLG